MPLARKLGKDFQVTAGYDIHLSMLLVFDPPDTQLPVTTTAATTIVVTSAKRREPSHQQPWSRITIGGRVPNMANMHPRQCAGDFHVAFLIICRC
jgi:hypothetical protein